MQPFIVKYRRRIAAIFCLLLASLTAVAQEKVEIDTNEIGSWFERNWIWVAVGVVLVILIAALGRSRNTVAGGKRRTTTVIKDASGNTKSVTTTEENI